jgi:hypothetical protein
MSAPGRSDQRRRRLFVLLAILLVLGVPLLAAEAFVRTAYRYNSPETVRRNSLQYAPTVFARHMLKPNQQIRVDEAWGLKSQEEPTGREYRINGMGYRGRPLAVRKPEGTRRIVILGGSAVFDPAATEGQDWPHRVEEKLRQRGFPAVEVLNAGVPGHATFDSVGRFYSQIWTLQPDYLLVYEAWNDIKSFSEISPEHPLLLVVKPYDPAADPFQNYTSWADRLMSISQVYVKLRNRYLISEFQPGLEGALRQGERREEFDADAERQYRLDLELLVDGARDIGAVPVLMTQGSLVSERTSDVDRNKINYGYQSLNATGLLKAFQACDGAVHRVASEKGVGMVDAAAVLDGRGEYFEDHVHLSLRGGDVLSDLVADYLAKDFGKANAAPGRPAHTATTGLTP